MHNINQNEYKRSMKYLDKKGGAYMDIGHGKGEWHIQFDNTRETSRIRRELEKKKFKIIDPNNEGKIREKKESAIDVVKRIVKDRQYEQGVDAQTANLIMKIYNAYDKHPALQKKFEKIPLKKMAHMVWKFVK